MTREFADRDLVGGFLEFDDLLVLELGLFMDYKVRVEWALITLVLTRDPLPATSSGQGDALETTFDTHLFGVLAISAFDCKDRSFGGQC